MLCRVEDLPTEAIFVKEDIYLVCRQLLATFNLYRILEVYDGPGDGSAHVRADSDVAGSVESCVYQHSSSTKGCSDVLGGEGIAVSSYY